LAELQTAQSQPIKGTPPEGPQPRIVTRSIDASLGFASGRAERGVAA
jgi:hypothetical protein